MLDGRSASYNCPCFRGGWMEERGSEKLLARLCGAEGTVTDEALGKAVNEAQQAGIKIVRWWWKGQPAIDHITQVLELSPGSVGSTIENLIRLGGNQRAINLEVFPWGVPAIDRVHVTINTEINK